MMNVLSDRPIAVFDLDGVLVENPPEARIKGAPPIQDFNFWERHWSNHSESKVQGEIVHLMKSLMRDNWQSIVLTARPERFRQHTTAFLRANGVWAASSKPELLTSMVNYVLVEMWPTDGYVGGSGTWKRDCIRKWKSQGAKIQFMVEDYKPNAEAIRSEVPVLLYERVR